MTNSRFPHTEKNLIQKCSLSFRVKAHYDGRGFKMIYQRFNLSNWYLKMLIYLKKYWKKV